MESEGRLVSESEIEADATEPNVPSVGAPTKLAGIFEPGARLGRYLVLERLGAGGMGVVLAAYDPELDRKIAIKLIHPDRARPTMAPRERLLREARALARLSHPGIVGVHDIGVVDDRVFVAMEYIDGVNLRRWQHERARSLAEILAVFVQAGRALAVAHAAGLAHRDFKPDNVMIDRRGRVVVLDFGLARVLGESDSDAELANLGMQAEHPDASEFEGDASEAESDALTYPGTILGTPRYMSPEQRLGRPASFASDQFSFCVALWEALGSRLPFASGPRGLPAIRKGKPRPLERRDLPSALVRALERGMAWQPAARWSDMNALLARLEPRRQRGTLALIGVGSLAALLLGWSVGETRSLDHRTIECSTLERVTHVWSGERADALAEHFAAVEGQASWDRTAPTLEAWAASWYATDAQVCRGQVEPALSGQTRTCLDERLARFDDLLVLLAAITREELPAAIDLARDLPEIDECLAARPAGELGDPEHARRRMDVLRRLIRIQRLGELGRLADAERDAAALIGELETIDEIGLLGQARALRGYLLVELDRSEEGERELERALVAASLEGTPRLRVEIYARLARVALARTDLSRCELWLDQAEQVLAAIVDPPGELAAEVARVRSSQRQQVANNQDDRIAALAFEVAALAHVDRRRQPLDWVRMQTNVGFSSMRVGKLEAARLALLEALRFSDETFGTTTSDSPLILGNLAEAEYQLGLTRVAELHFTEASERALAMFGPEHKVTWLAQLHHARFLDHTGHCEPARAELDDLLARALTKLPEVSPVRFNLLRARAEVCEWSTPEALERVEQALVVVREAFGDEHTATAETLAHRGFVLLARDRPSDALVDFEAALALCERLSSTGDTRYAFVQAGLGLSLRARDAEPERARKNLASAAQLLPATHRLRPRVLAALGE
ncbi:protein kinase domain-containing protein [Nannocystaceae bacterium ST9]